MSQFYRLATSSSGVSHKLQRILSSVVCSRQVADGLCQHMCCLSGVPCVELLLFASHHFSATQLLQEQLLAQLQLAAHDGLDDGQLDLQAILLGQPLCSCSII